MGDVRGDSSVRNSPYPLLLLLHVWTINGAFLVRHVLSSTVTDRQTDRETDRRTSCQWVRLLDASHVAWRSCDKSTLFLISPTAINISVISHSLVPDMTYNVFGGTLNLAHSNQLELELETLYFQLPAKHMWRWVGMNVILPCKDGWDLAKICTPLNWPHVDGHLHLMSINKRRELTFVQLATCATNCHVNVYLRVYRRSLDAWQPRTTRGVLATHVPGVRYSDSRQCSGAGRHTAVIDWGFLWVLSLRR